MAELKLLPCPFCGGEPAVVEDDSYGGCGISCSTCDIMPDASCGKVGEIDQCITAWNTRPAASPITGEARDALEPFAHFAANNTDDEGWAGLCCQNDRIRDWLGPSEFRRALKVFSALATPKP